MSRSAGDGGAGHPPDAVPADESRDGPSAGEAGGTAPGDVGPKGPGGARRPPPPTRRETVRGLARELSGAGRDAAVDDARLEAERLVAHVLGIDRAELARTGSEPIGPDQASRLARAVRRRLSGEPLQHIEGTVHFRELVLAADPRALVPRPETEQLVDRIAAWAGTRADPAGPRPIGAEGERSRGSRVIRAGARGRRRGPPPLESALDIGTGSGAIALSLVAEGVARRAVGVDVSEAALEQARENREAAGLGPEEVDLRPVMGGLWDALGENERFDLVVSNPPYVRDEAIEGLPAQIREHEPREALAGGEDGLRIVREIVAGAAARLRPGGALFLEIGDGQGDAVLELLERAGTWADARVARDLGGEERFVQAHPVAGTGPEVDVEEG